MLASVPALTNTLSTSNSMNNTVASSRASCAATAAVGTTSRSHASNSTKSAFYTLQHEWPLNELQENIMTIATSSLIHSIQQQHQQHIAEEEMPSSPSSCSSVEGEQSSYPSRRRSSAAVRCQTCQRKFHSLGNLANHQQLYQHH